MPIRTNRGRAAVYRRLWGFPLRSPRHLAGTAIAVAVLLVGLGIAIPQLLGPRQSDQVTPARIKDPSSSAAAVPPGTSSTTLPTRLTAPLVQPTSAAPAPEALDVAKRWAQAWVNHPDGITNAQWLDGLRPYTTEEYLAQMSTVDPRNIPAKQVTGEPRATESYTSSVLVIVPTDGPQLSITVARTPGGWLVAGYDQAS
ncbi:MULTISPECIES: hypothetical protein [Amycolatopsis]|uniref:DUF4878 domain-containing protein n=1 Tax=Amycolatopsis dongchuanensis TaxID=1070866 RepID=A0ABP8VJZ5_9PSEU